MGQGYDGTRLADLTYAMGISRLGMDATFGTKETLFGKAPDRSVEGPATFATRALAEATVQQLAITFLHGSVWATTDPDRPAGCLSVQARLAAGIAGRPVRDFAVH